MHWFRRNLPLFLIFPFLFFIFFLYYYLYPPRPSLDSGVSLSCPGLSLGWEVRDPDRDCTNFDPVERARELFEALDVDGDGGVTEEEFVQAVTQQLRAGSGMCGRFCQ